MVVSPCVLFHVTCADRLRSPSFQNPRHRWQYTAFDTQHIFDKVKEEAERLQIPYRVSEGEWTGRGDDDGQGAGKRNARAHDSTFAPGR